MKMKQTNHTEDDLSCYNPSVVGYRYFAVLCGCAVTIIGTVGNLMTILAFAIDPHLRTRFNVLIVNLALADLLYCTIVQPSLVDSYLHLRWRIGQLWCRIFGLLLLLFNCVSIITLCLIAGGRYLMVAKRAVFDRVFSDLCLSLLIISAWALVLASICPLWHGYVFEPKFCVCTITRTTYHPYSIILLIFYFVVGLGCVGIFYLLIYRHVRIASQTLLRYRFSRRSSRRKPAFSAQDTNDSGVESSVANTCSCEISSQAELAATIHETIREKSSQSTQSSAIAVSASNSPPDIVTTPPSPTPAPTNAASSSHCTASEDDKEMKHVTRMCLAVFLCFVFCFVPFLLIHIADEHNSAPLVLYMFFGNLTWLNSCINPVLYAVMNRRFRRAYHVLLTRAAAPFTCLWTWWSSL
ncbi:G-protein coupled receptor 84-like [Sparus aurata]|uniref:G-protein coupled receptor 84-like n=1 Tax=Sparus aurata TaxID=8175 RepID=A0A671TFM0_SPAAU|nr:G-protein coupled receptor 84-like [Sparus aurata]XP_030274985.1 G-protein coupled receptor 84-like [Sparus aurata]